MTKKDEKIVAMDERTFKACSSLSPDSYTYSLYINNKLMDTKQMILTHE